MRRQRRARTTRWRWRGRSFAGQLVRLLFLLRRLQPNLLKADIDRLGPPALARTLRRAGAAPTGRVRAVPSCVGMPARAPVFFVEGVAEPSQFQDHRFALRAEFAGGGIVVPTRRFVLFKVID